MPTRSSGATNEKAIVSTNVSATTQLRRENYAIATMQ